MCLFLLVSVCLMSVRLLICLSVSLCPSVCDFLSHPAHTHTHTHTLTPPFSLNPSPVLRKWVTALYMHSLQATDWDFNQIRHKWRGRGRGRDGGEERRNQQRQREREREREREWERERESTEGYIDSKLVCVLLSVWETGRESRQDGVLAQMKTVPGYVFVAILVHVLVCACVRTCACMCASGCERGESGWVCEQHGASDHPYVGTRPVNLGVVT